LDVVKVAEQLEKVLQITADKVNIYGGTIAN